MKIEEFIERYISIRDRKEAQKDLVKMGIEFKKDVFDHIESNFWNNEAKNGIVVMIESKEFEELKDQLLERTKQRG